MTSAAVRVAPLATCRLQPHPQTPCDVVAEVTVDVGVAAGGVLALRYAIVGERDRLRIPAAGASLDPERLWAHTCCELFVAPATGAGYVEWNFSPSGQLARFAFATYRERIASAQSTVAGPTVTLQDGALVLEVSVPLPPGIGATTGVSLSAVIEDASGALSYWALRHPCDRPDFHHPESFALALTLGPPVAIVHR